MNFDLKQCLLRYINIQFGDEESPYLRMDLISIDGLRNKGGGGSDIIIKNVGESTFGYRQVYSNQQKANCLE